MILAEICGRGTDCRGAARLAMTARQRRADGTDRVVRPYFLSFRASPQTGVAHGPRPTGCGVHSGGQSRPPLQSRTRTVRNGTSYPKGICSAALHCRTPSPTKNAGCRGGDGGAMWASSPTERRRGVPYRRRSQDMLATARPPMRTVTAPSFSYKTLRISDGRDMCSPCRNTFSSPGFTSPRR